MFDSITLRASNSRDEHLENTRLQNNTVTPVSKFDKVIEYLLVSLLVFMPLAFGAVEAWSEEIVVALTAAISITFLLKLVFEKNTTFIWSWAFLPATLFILVVVFQLIPLPISIVSLISPNTASIKQELLGDLPNLDYFLKSITLSFYSHATRHNLRLVLSVVAVFIVVVNVYRQEDQIIRLLGAIAIIGGLIAVLALVQDLFGNGNIYWIVPTGFGSANSGPFINHSHYGQFMNLSIGAALGLLILKIHEAFADKHVTPSAVSEYFSSPESRTMWLLLAMMIISVATIFLSLTRGGMISMFIAAGLTTLALGSRQSLRGHGWIMVLLALGAFICVLYLGFDAVYERLASLGQLHQAEGGRQQMVKDILFAWTKFPLFGTGLGTHEVVYPMFDSSMIAYVAAFAENEYAQTIEETGFIGLVILIIFGIIIWAGYIRNIRSTSVPIRSVAYGLGLGLLAILIHSMSDFGQHIPANAMLSAASCALILSLSHFGNKVNPATSAVGEFRGSRNLRVVALLCASGIWGWMILGANNARIAESGWKKALAIENNLMKNNWQATNKEYIDLISNAATAANYQPDNIKYRHWLNVYRWKSISRITDPNTGQIVIPEQALEFVRRIVDELNQSRLLCPTYGATYCVVGQLQLFTLGDPNGAECIKKGYKLAQCDPVACFVTGILDAEEQNIDAAFEKFNRAVQLDNRMFGSVVNVLVNHMNRPDLAVVISGDNSMRLSYVADAFADMDEHKDLFDKAQTQIIDLLRKKCAGPDASAGAFASLAKICMKENDLESAIINYRHALVLDYSQVQWRYKLAGLLANLGRTPEAIHEARICLRLSPQFMPAEKLIADLSVLPGGAMNADLLP